MWSWEKIDHVVELVGKGFVINPTSSSFYTPFKNKRVLTAKKKNNKKKLDTPPKKGF